MKVLVMVKDKRLDLDDVVEEKAVDLDKTVRERTESKTTLRYWSEGGW